MTDTLTRYGRTFRRSADGGWLEDGASLPEGSTARICGDAVVMKSAAEKMHGGGFHDGLFRGGEFYDGAFWSGDFHGGVFWNGDFHSGVFHGGMFHDGVFWGGEFHGGHFHGGDFHGGVFFGSPCCAQRSDGYMFVAKIVDGQLRIWAGCRDFSWDQAVAHWNDEHRHGAESQRIIHFLKAQAEAEAARDAAKMGELS